MKNHKDIIRRNSGIRFGRPCIRETRITVYDILSWLASGMTNEEIISDYSELIMADIQASLSCELTERKIHVA